MRLKTIIFNSELEFRNYVIKNLEYISQIIVFEDVLEGIIYFYCFIQEDVIIAAKEASKEFSWYQEIYQCLANEEKLYIAPNKENQVKVLKLLRHSENNFTDSQL